MLKRALLGLAGLLVILVGILLIRTLMVPPLPPAKTAAADDSHAQEAARHLSEAVRFKTISHQAGSKPEEIAASHQAMEGFRDWLSATYPAFAEATTREVVGGYSLLFTWKGTDPSLKPILLMSHFDVVPVVPGTEGKWEEPPFSGKIAGGYVWGRGTIDTKGSLVAMVEAANTLASEGFRPARTVMFAFGHDEELGGREGNTRIAAMLEERGVKLDWVADEGGVIGEHLLPGISAPVALIGVAEKGYISLKLTAHAAGGHSSMPPAVPETAIGRLSRAIDRLGHSPFDSEMEGTSRRMIEDLAPAAPFLRRIVFANMWLFEPLVRGALEKSHSGAAQLHTTISPTIIEGGTKENVLPPEASAVVNFRIHPRDNARKVVAHVKQAIDDPEVDIETLPGVREASKVSNVNGPAYRYLTQVVKESFPGVVPVPNLTVGGTDSRHYLPLTDNVFRFIPIRMGPGDLSRFHGTNERVSVENMGEAVNFYIRLMKETGPEEGGPAS